MFYKDLKMENQDSQKSVTRICGLWTTSALWAGGIIVASAAVAWGFGIPFVVAIVCGIATMVVQQYGAVKIIIADEAREGYAARRILETTRESVTAAAKAARKQVIEDQAYEKHCNKCAGADVEEDVEEDAFH